MSGDLKEKLAKVGQCLIDSPNPVFQETGRLLTKYSSMDVLSSQDLQRAEKIIDMIDSFID